MLFKHRFHPGIADGSITLTFRSWKSARVTVGKRYRLAPIGVIEVDAVDEVSLGAVSPAAARRAGFADKAELVDFLGPDAGSRLFRVKFHFTGNPQDERRVRGANASDEAVAQVRERLELMDRRSARGPWTRELLKLIGAKPHVAASRLAPKLGRETLPFKADVRKLKSLGLTISHETGYELSPLGKAVLARESKRAKRARSEA